VTAVTRSAVPRPQSSDHKQGEADGAWSEIVPKTDWGMDSPAWNEMLGEILEVFRLLIRPAVIKPDATFGGSRGKALSDLQTRLASSVQ
jgi:hypothetical protein